MLQEACNFFLKLVAQFLTHRETNIQHWSQVIVSTVQTLYSVYMCEII